MNYNNLKLFRPVNDVVINPNGYDGKHISFTVLGENVDYFKALDILNFRKTHVRYSILPSTTTPVRTFMDLDYRKKVTDYKLKPIKIMFEQLKDMKEQNHYIDSTFFIDAAINRWNIDKFNTKKAIWVVNSFLNNIQLLPSDKFEKSLMYVVDLDNLKQKMLMYRKILPVYLSLYKNSINKDIEGGIVFDKLFLVTYTKNGNKREITLLFDKNKKLDISRIRKFLISLQPQIDKNENNKVYADDVPINPDEFNISDSELNDVEKFQNNIKEETTNADDVQQVKDTMSSTWNSIKPSMKQSAALAGASIGAVGLAMIGSYISKILQKRNWYKKGCAKIEDPYKRGECENYIKLKTVDELEKVSNKCKDQTCIDKIKDQIQNILSEPDNRSLEQRMARIPYANRTRQVYNNYKG